MLQGEKWSIFVLMKIDSSIVGMESARSYTAVQSSTRRFALTDYTGANQLKENQLKENLPKDDQQKEKLNTEKNEGEEKSPLVALQEKLSAMRTELKLRTSESLSAETIRQRSIMYILDLLFGHKEGKTRNDWEENCSDDSQNLSAANNLLSVTSGNTNLTTFSNSIQMVCTESTYFSETEETAFSTTGLVKTADGRELSFNIDVTLSRSFSRYYESVSTVNVAQFCDPLVITLDDSPLTVSDQKFTFDIDADGQMDVINHLGAGNGYLALDRNNDGKINDGSELFGTKSGNGFEDLAEFDSDGNGWIDENDDVWSKLKVWTTDEAGNEKLYTLAQTGVGAICLQNVSTDFTMKDEDNNSTALVRRSGVFLYENGASGMIRQLDMAKYRMEA